MNVSKNLIVDFFLIKFFRKFTNCSSNIRFNNSSIYTSKNSNFVRNEEKFHDFSLRFHFDLPPSIVTTEESYPLCNIYRKFNHSSTFCRWNSISFINSQKFRGGDVRKKISREISCRVLLKSMCIFFEHEEDARALVRSRLWIPT